MNTRLIVMLVAILLISSACSEVPAPSGSAATPAASGSTVSPSGSVPVATPGATASPTPGIIFRALDLPAEYTRAEATAVDGTTAVGFVQKGPGDDEQPAVWNTSTGALRVLDVPAEFVHPNGDIFVRLDGVSGTTAVGKGVLGSPDKRGLDQAMAWDTTTGAVRVLDVPDGFTRATAQAISGTTAVGQVWTTDGMDGRSVAWDTTTGAVRTLELPAGYDCADPQAVSGDTVVGIRCDGDEALPLVWYPLGTAARDLGLLPTVMDGVPVSIDGATAVGWCCFGEEGTPIPLAWDTLTGSARQLSLPAPYVSGKALGVSGEIAVGFASDGGGSLVWNLDTGDVRILPPSAGYEAGQATNAVSGHTVVGAACQPPPTSAENPRCVAAAWTLP